VLAGALSLLAAQAVGVFADPCRDVPAMPEAVRLHQERSLAARKANQPSPRAAPEAGKAYGEWQRALYATDFAGQCRYRAANRQLPPASARRVVFFGDSITEAWSEVRPEFFHADWINRGISGQTTKQMIGRFRSDVIDLRPRVVHILAGINDISQATGPTSLDQIEGNLSSMVELAQAHGIAVVLGTVMPARTYQGVSNPDRAAAITALNSWLRSYAQRERIALIDYYRALDDGSESLSPRTTSDGIHPNAAGYAAIEPLADRAIATAITRSGKRRR
jgi:lysophospholipase L1-like esterase